MEKDVKYPYMTSRQGTKNLMYRRPIPRELQKYFGGKKEFPKTLGTPDKEEAVPLYLELAAHYEEELRKAREGLPTGTEFDKVKRQRARKYNKAVKNQFAYAEETGTAAYYDPEDGLDEHFFFVEDSRLRIEIKGLQRDKKAGIGDSRIIEGDIQAREHVIAGTVPETEPEPSTAPTFKDLMPKYLAEREQTVGGRAYEKDVHALPEFVKVCGDKPIDKYLKKDGRKYLEFIRKLPGRYEDETLNSTTINNRLRNVGLFFKWLHKTRDEDIKNPVFGFTVKKPKGEISHAKKTFSPAQLNKIFASFKKKDDLYWLCLIGLYTSLRPQAIVQLKVEDIQEEDGILCFDIHRRNGNELKNDYYIRMIPIHSILLKLGIEAFIKNRGQGYLFPSIAKGVRIVKTDKGKQDKWRDNLGKKFAHRLRTLGLKTINTAFYSFRDTFATACRDCQVEYTSRLYLQGRKERGSMAYYGDAANIKVQKAEIEKISFGIEIEN